MTQESRHRYGRIETLKERAERAEGALLYLVNVHHRTIIGSGKHDPENQEWTACECRTCAGVRELLPEQAETAAAVFALEEADDA